MHRKARQAFEQALDHGYAALHAGDYTMAYRQFERAHVIGQYEAIPHSRSHWAFMVWGWKQRDPREILGQCLRLPVGIFGSLIGWLPAGNTGGATVSATRRMPLPEDIRQLLQEE